MKKIRQYTLILVAFLLSTVSLAAETDSLQMAKSDKDIAVYVTRIMEAYHYTGLKLDNEISERMFDEFFQTLDYNRRIFLKSDIEEFSVYKMLLDDMFKRGDMTFSVKLYSRYMKRLEERITYTHERLKKPFDFTVVEDYQVDRSEAAWAETSEQLDEIWRKQLKNEILGTQISELAEKEKAAEEGGPAKEEEKGEKKQKITAIDRLHKRYENFLKYQKDNDKDFLLEMSLNVMTKCFDPHSNYFGAKAQEEFEISMRLSLTGIGATLTVDDGYTKITSLVPGGPAHQSKKVKVNDRIFAVAQGDEEPVDCIDMRLSKVVSMIRGKKGTTVKLHILRGGVNGSKHIVSIVRDEIKLKDSEAKGEIKEVKFGEDKVKKVGVIHLPSFYSDWSARSEGREGKSSTADVKRILEGQMKEGIEALIIDLRNNGGGSLPESINLTGLFIDKGPVVQIRENGGRIIVRNDENEGTVYDGPLVVLVNEGSASASEIFAAAIQDYKRGVIVGTHKTHGKGTVQQVHALKRLRAFANRNDVKPGQVKYTMAKFYRINGGSTQKKGVVPDIVLPSYSAHDDHGEATLRYVLKWDEIRNLDVELNAKVQNSLPEIMKRSQDRVIKSEDFKTLKDDIDYFKEKINDKTVSLNKEKRIAQYRKDKEIREKRKEIFEKLLGQAAEGEESNESKIVDDIYLGEALKVVSDLEELQKAQASK